MVREAGPLPGRPRLPLCVSAGLGGYSPIEAALPGSSSNTKISLLQTTLLSIPVVRGSSTSPMSSPFVIEVAGLRVLPGGASGRHCRLI